MSDILLERQLDYFKRSKYRSAVHFATKACVIPKVKFIDSYVPLKGASILDLGCGNGAYTDELVNYTEKVVGLDVSRQMLLRNPVNKLIEGNVESLPIKDSSFDIVFAANLLHHANNHSSIINEMKRVSKRYVVIIEPNCINPIVFLYFLLVKAERGGLKSTKRKLWQLLENSDLSILKIAVTGMISQNNTPAFLIPYLKRFDKEISLGEFIILVAEKKNVRLL